MKKRSVGRPRKPKGTKYLRAELTIAPKLYVLLNRAATKSGLTRSGFIAKAVGREIARQKRLQVK